MNDDVNNLQGTAPCWTPYDPESVIGEFGWLHLPDGPMGPEWHLICTVEPDGKDVDRLYTRFIQSDELPQDDEPVEDAADYAGRPYMSVAEPSIVPGECDAIEVRIHIENGASIGTAYAEAARARHVIDAVKGSLSAEEESGT